MLAPFVILAGSLFRSYVAYYALTWIKVRRGDKMYSLVRNSRSHFAATFSALLICFVALFTFICKRFAPRTLDRRSTGAMVAGVLAAILGLLGSMSVKSLLLDPRDKAATSKDKKETGAGTEELYHVLVTATISLVALVAVYVDSVV